MYYLGNKSKTNLEGVHQDLVRVVTHAISITNQDFSVIEGLRSKERQAELVARGASQTMNSRHLTGHAVDLAAWTGSGIDWDDEAKYYAIADAMIMAAYVEDVPITWGAAWHHVDLRTYKGSAEKLCKQYVAVRTTQGRTPFLDFVHFELAKNHY